MPHPRKIQNDNSPKDASVNPEQAAPDLAHPKGALTTQEAPVQPGEDTNLVFSKALSKNNWVKKREKSSAPPHAQEDEDSVPTGKQHPRPRSLKTCTKPRGPDSY